MRFDCKFYESRTYPSGDTVRMCQLDLAPEAPWRCPENCPSYRRKTVDAGWVTGSLSTKPEGEEPGPLDEGAIGMLDEAEDILNAAGPAIIAEEMERRRVEQERARRKPRRWWWPFS
jgi:hypothetical protein